MSLRGLPGPDGAAATLAWLLGDEVTEAIRRLFDAVANHGAFVPSLWRLKVANGLAGARHRGRIDPKFRGAALDEEMRAAGTGRIHSVGANLTF